MGRFVDKRLNELGCTRIFKHGEGDDDGEYVTFPNSLTKLWEFLQFKE